MAVPSILIIQNWIWGEKTGFQGDNNDHLPIYKALCQSKKKPLLIFKIPRYNNIKL